MHTPDPVTIVIFGASGDLTYRKLVPALHSLVCAGMLPSNFVIVGAARSDLSNEAFRARMKEDVDRFGRLSGDDCQPWEEFSQRLFYQRISYDDADAYRTLAAFLLELEKQYELPGNRLFYLSTPPSLYAPIVETLGAVSLANYKSGFTRVVIEKPFGTDLQSARDLNRRIHQVFQEKQIYRIDHYLGKETVQNIMVFRFANAIF